MELVFFKIVNMGITAGWMFLVILIFRKFFKDIPKVIKYIIWGMLAVRIVCPVFFKCPFSLIPSIETISEQKALIYLDSGIGFLDDIINGGLINLYVTAVEDGVQTTKVSPVFIVSIIWLVMAITIALYYEVREKNQKKNNENYKKVPGFFKGIGVGILALHWYNPLYWLAYKIYCKDIDEENSGQKTSKKGIVAGVFLCIVLAICYLTNPQTIKTKDGDLYDIPYENRIVYHSEKGNVGIYLYEKTGEFTAFSSPNNEHKGYYIETDDQLVIRDENMKYILVFDINGDEILVDKEKSVYEYNDFKVQENAPLTRLKFENGVYEDNGPRSNDCVIFDIDNDGKNERLFVGHGSTSGVGSFEIYVMYKNKLEAKNEFINWNNEGFEVIDDTLYIKISCGLVQKKYEVAVKDDVVVLIDGDDILLELEYPKREQPKEDDTTDHKTGPNTTSGSYYKPWEFRDMNINIESSKWCWQRSAESEHFYVFWEEEFGLDPNAKTVPENMRVDIDDLLEKAEKFYDKNVELGFYNPEEMDNKISDYKLQIYIKYQEEWLATGSGYDNKVGALWINPSTCKPVGSTIAHEIGHCFQYLVYCHQVAEGEPDDYKHGFRYGYEGSNGGNGFWEQTAQWQAMQNYPNELFLDYQMYTWFRMNNKSFENEWMRYQGYWFFYYMTEKHGMDTISNIWKNSKWPEDALSCYMRLYLDNDLEKLYNELFDYAMHMATFDLDVIRDYAGKYHKDYNIKLYDAGDGYEQVAYSDCPEPGGFNVIRIDFEDGQEKVTIDFKAMEAGAKLSKDDPSEYKKNGEYEGTVENYNETGVKTGFKYGFVALCEDDSRVYSEQFSGDENVLTYDIPKNAKYVYFVVLATSQEYYCHPWDDDELTDAMAPFKLKIY